MAQLLYFGIACAVLVVATTASATTRQKESDCSSQSFIKSSLANLTSQFSAALSPTESSLTSVTSLLQLSLLRELLNEYKKEPTGNGSNEGIAILQRIELILNTSVVNIGERLDAVESELNRVYAKETRILSAVKKNSQLLLNHSNLTQTTLNQLDEKIDPEIETSLLRSCAEVLKNSSSSPSGYYTLADANGHPRKVYCHMGSLCNSGGGWNRVSILNMKNSNEKCPTGLRSYHQNGARACGRPVSSGGSCSGVIFPVNFEYSQVCGKIIGYQKGLPDGTRDMDGIRLTHGSSQSHIWSFLAAFNGNDAYNKCPCSSSGRPVPSYVGSDYYCETGNKGTYDLNRLYTSDRLWDGNNCQSSEEACCNRPLIPWFHKKLGYTTNDYIEMRFCFNEGTHDEDSPVEEYEIYVK